MPWRFSNFDSHIGLLFAAMKKGIDDRYLHMLGGVGLVLKKGKLKLL
ncbi:hypothetical protein [Sporolactobacillus laevolacticus]|nr:hypothetical protein [Sporolactobacillus laevolacticus]MDN3954288.1 hypothetical protein [Sporolactobacillus laevolacticus]